MRTSFISSYGSRKRGTPRLEIPCPIELWSMDNNQSVAALYHIYVIIRATELKVFMLY